MEHEVPGGLPEVFAEFAAKRLGSAELREVAGELEVAAVGVAEESAGEPGVEQVVVQSVESAVESAEDPEVAHLG